MPFPRLSALVSDQQERVVEQPAEVTVVERPREPHDPEGESTRLSTNAEKRPAPVLLRGSGHDLTPLRCIGSLITRRAPRRPRSYPKGTPRIFGLPP